MEKCREQFYKEIDILEHIMQFREVRADMEIKNFGKPRPTLLRARTRTIQNFDDSNDESSSVVVGLS